MKKLAFLSFLITSAVHGYTLEEAVVAAYNNNSGWKASQAEKSSADSLRKQAQAAFFPTVSASLSSARTADDTVHKYHPEEGGVSNSTTTNMAIQVKQNLFNSFQDVNGVQSKEHAAQAAYHALKKAEQDLIVNVVIAFTAVWAERQKLKAYKKKEENLQKLYESQKICLETGMSTPADVAEAESKYQTAVYERVNAETQVTKAEAIFMQITGTKADNDMDIPDLGITLPKTLDELKSTALKSNHEIERAKYAEKSALSDLSVARGRLGPSCNLSMSAMKALSKNRPKHDRDATNRHYAAELSVSVPIVDVTAYQTIGYYSDKAKQANFTLNDKISEIKRNCEIYWREYIAAEASIRASRSAVKSAEITSESNLDQATFGMKSNTEFLDGETSLLNARNNLTTAVKNRIDVLVQLFALTGKLDLTTFLSRSGKAKPKSVDTKKDRIRHSESNVVDAVGRGA